MWSWWSSLNESKMIIFECYHCWQWIIASTQFEWVKSYFSEIVMAPSGTPEKKSNESYAPSSSPHNSSISYWILSCHSSTLPPLYLANRACPPIHSSHTLSPSPTSPLPYPPHQGSRANSIQISNPEAYLDCPTLSSKTSPQCDLSYNVFRSILKPILQLFSTVH